MDCFLFNHVSNNWNFQIIRFSKNLNQNSNFLHLIFMTRKIKYIIGMIWWQFRKKKIKRRLFERIRVLSPSKS